MAVESAAFGGSNEHAYAASQAAYMPLIRAVRLPARPCTFPEERRLLTARTTTTAPAEMADVLEVARSTVAPSVWASIVNRMKLIQGALVLRPGTFAAEPLDVLIDGGAIADVVPRGSVKGEGMEVIDAAGCALMPGLVNGHNHAQTHLAKGRFDRYNLELY